MNSEFFELLTAAIVGFNTIVSILTTFLIRQLQQVL
jgi:hypothetical protein